MLEFLHGRNGEFLLNFMSEHVNRHAEYSQVAASFGRFLADPDWADDFNALPSDWSNEKRVLHLFRLKTKATEAATYLPDFPIMKPREQRVKMRLVLGTHSVKGLEVFRDVQGKVERAEIETRNQLRNPRDRQISLFSDDVIAAMQQNAAGIGCPAYQREAKALVVQFLSERHFATFTDLSADVLETVQIRLTQIKKLIIEMKSEGVVTFELPLGKRVPQPDTRVTLV